MGGYPGVMPGIVVPLAQEPLWLTRLLLDLNGTLARDGRLLPGISPRIARLRGSLRVLLVSGDTFGTARRRLPELGVPFEPLGQIGQGAQKLRIARRLGPRSVVMVGNGRNDAPALAEVALGMCVVGPEGAAADALLAADVVVGSPEAALDLLLHPSRLVATLRR